MELKTRKDLLQEWIRRFVAYTDSVTWFGGNSVIRAMGWATAILVEACYLLVVALVRRYSVMNAAGDDLTVVAAERGADRRGASHARLLVVIDPETANVADIRPVAGDDYIEIDDSSFFLAADSFRIRSQDGTTSEAATIAAISVGTGLINGWDELVVLGGLAGVYAPLTEDVDVLARVTIAEETEILSSAGVSFHTLEAMVTGDANPVLDGEGTALALADKVWAESTTAGVSGNIEADTLTEFSAGAQRGVARVWNPEAGVGGEDAESDLALKYRAIHGPTVASAETLSWIEQAAAAANDEVLRAVRGTEFKLGTLLVKVLRRNGGSFSAGDLAAMSSHTEARVRSYMEVEYENITLTAVAVEAQITLEPGYTLEAVWRAAASELVTFLDYRKWAFGASVDEADLLAIVNGTAGVVSLVTASFVPAADITVSVESLPTLVSLSLEDTDTGDTILADLAASF